MPRSSLRAEHDSCEPSSRCVRPPLLAPPFPSGNPRNARFSGDSCAASTPTCPRFRPRRQPRVPRHRQSDRRSGATDTSKLNPLIGLNTVTVNCPAVESGPRRSPANSPLIASVIRCASVASVSAGNAATPNTVPPSALPPVGFPPVVVAPLMTVPAFGGLAVAPPTVTQTISALPIVPDRSDRSRAKVPPVPHALERKKYAGVKVEIAAEPGLAEYPHQPRRSDLVCRPRIVIARATHPRVRHCRRHRIAQHGRLEEVKQQVPLATVKTTVCAPAATPAAISRRPEVGLAAACREYALTGTAVPPSTETWNIPPAVETAVPRYRLCACWQW